MASPVATLGVGELGFEPLYVRRALGVDLRGAEVDLGMLTGGQRAGCRDDDDPDGYDNDTRRDCEPDEDVPPSHTPQLSSRQATRHRENPDL